MVTGIHITIVFGCNHSVWVNNKGMFFTLVKVSLRVKNEI